MRGVKLLLETTGSGNSHVDGASPAPSPVGEQRGAGISSSSGGSGHGHGSGGSSSTADGATASAVFVRKRTYSDESQDPTAEGDSMGAGREPAGSEGDDNTARRSMGPSIVDVPHAPPSAGSRRGALRRGKSYHRSTMSSSSH